MTSLKAFFAHLSLRRVTNSTTYVPQMDGLRLLALLPVLFWHSGVRGLRFYGEKNHLTVTNTDTGLPHGHIGVYLFFFISGYIIAYPFFKRGMQDIGSFYTRRLSRLHPPYVLALTLCFLALLITQFKPSHAPSFGNNEIPLVGSFLASLFYLHGLIFNAPPRVDPPLWSLEIEIQFYLLAPLLFALIARIKTQTVLILSVVTLAFAALSVWLSATYGEYGYHNRIVFTYFYTFMLGIALSRYAIDADPFNQRPHVLFDLGFVAGVAAWLYSGYFEERHLTTAECMLRGGLHLVSIVLIYFGAARGTIARAVIGHPWIATLGGMCYSIYLVHVPLMQIVAELLFRKLPMTTLPVSLLISFALLIPVSLFCGAIFFILIERPCMDPKWPQKLVARLQGRSDKVTNG